MAQLKGDKGVLNIQENLNEQHGRLMEKYETYFLK